MTDQVSSTSPLQAQGYCAFPSCEIKLKGKGTVCKSCKQHFCSGSQSHCRHQMHYRLTKLGPRWYVQKPAFSRGETVKVCNDCFQKLLAPQLVALNPVVDKEVMRAQKKIYGEGARSGLWNSISLPVSLAPIYASLDRETVESSDSEAEQSDHGSALDDDSDRSGRSRGGPWLNDDRLAKLLEAASVKAQAAGLLDPPTPMRDVTNTLEFGAFAAAFGGTGPTDRLVPSGVECRFCTVLASRLGMAADSDASLDMHGTTSAQGTCAAHGGYHLAPIDRSLELIAPSVSGVWLAALISRRNSAAGVTANRACIAL